MAVTLVANIPAPTTVRADVQTGGTVRVNVTPPATRVTTTVTNIIRANIKDIGPKGEKGDSGGIFQGLTKITVGPIAPTGASEGDLWVDTS